MCSRGSQLGRLLTPGQAAHTWRGCSQLGRLLTAGQVIEWLEVQVRVQCLHIPSWDGMLADWIF